MDAILVERDYKGLYERFALTPEEFEKEFPETVAKGDWPVKESDSDTIAPLVHIWFEPCKVGDEKWNTFFTDMEEGLPESDIEAGNLAYIRDDLFQSLGQYMQKEQRFYVCYEELGIASYGWTKTEGFKSYDEADEWACENLNEMTEIKIVDDFVMVGPKEMEQEFSEKRDIKYPLLSDCADFEYLKEHLSETELTELEKILDAYVCDKIDITYVRDEDEQIDFEGSFELIVGDPQYKQTGLETVAIKWYESFEDSGYLVDCFSGAFEYNSYRFTVDYSDNGKQKTFQIGISSKEKPDNTWLAQKISNYFSAHYNGSVENAIKSIKGIDVQITDYRGEYVDSDEIYGDDLKALFEHLKKDKSGLDNLISDAQQKVEEKKTWMEEKREELSNKPRSEWTEEDWEAHNYCENVTAEANYFDSLDDR